MFNNYLELFHGYVEFYRENLFAKLQRPEDQQTKPDVFAPLSVSLSESINHTDDLSNWTIAYSTTLDPHFQLTAGRDQTIDGETNTIIGTFNGLDVTDLLYIVTILVNLLFMRRCLSRVIKSSNLVKSIGLRKKDCERLDESVWRLCYYTFTSVWLFYSCFLKHQSHNFFDKNSQFTEYLSDMDLDEYLICMIEAGFYLHATYAIVFEDVWRRDSSMMLLHHIAAIFSVLGIYTTRTHRIGLAVIILRDTCDVLLEVTKIFLCLRIQKGKIINSLDKSLKCSLIIFTGAFVVNQLYYYPLFCLYHAFNMIKLHNIRTFVITGILTCCLIFLILDLLWFCLIVRLLYRMLFTDEPLKDLREYDEEENDDPTKNSGGEKDEAEKNEKSPVRLDKKNE